MRGVSKTVGSSDDVVREEIFTMKKQEGQSERTSLYSVARGMSRLGDACFTRDGQEIMSFRQFADANPLTERSWEQCAVTPPCDE